MPAKLAELFNSSRREMLIHRLDSASTLQNIANAIQDELKQFADVDGPYVNSLKRSEFPIAMAILALVRDSSGGYGEAAAPPEPDYGGTALASRKADSQRRRARSRANPPDAVTGQNDRSATPCVVVTLSSSVGASAGFFFGPIGAVIGAAVMGAAATVVLHMVKQEANDHAEAPLDAKVSINKQKICDGLLSLLTRIDALVAAYDQAQNTAQPEQKSPTLADFPDVLRLFQHAWSAVRTESSDQTAFVIQRQFPSVLRGLGLNVENLSDDDVARSQDDPTYGRMVDVDFSELVHEPTLDFPPICMDREVVLKGRVLFPITANEDGR